MTEDAPVTRVEFERAIGRLQAEIRASRSAAPVVEGALVPAGDFVRRDEFRLFKWFAGLAFAAILGGFGVLYQAVADLQRGLVEVQRGLAEVHQELAEVHQELAEVHQGLAEVHQILAAMHGRLVRVETVLEMERPPSRHDASPGGD